MPKQTKLVDSPCWKVKKNKLIIANVDINWKLTTKLHLEVILKADSSAFCNASTNFQFFLRNSYKLSTNSNNEDYVAFLIKFMCFILENNMREEKKNLTISTCTPTQSSARITRIPIIWYPTRNDWSPSNHLTTLSNARTANHNFWVICTTIDIDASTENKNKKL